MPTCDKGKTKKKESLRSSTNNSNKPQEMKS